MKSCLQKVFSKIECKTSPFYWASPWSVTRLKFFSKAASPGIISLVVNYKLNMDVIIQWDRCISLLHVYWLASCYICRYVVYQRLVCPRAYQPSVTEPCAETDQIIREVTPDVNTASMTTLSPYTAYRWRVEARNDAGETQSNAWSSTFITLSSGKLKESWHGRW